LAYSVISVAYHSIPVFHTVYLILYYRENFSVEFRIHGVNLA